MVGGGEEQASSARLALPRLGAQGAQAVVTKTMRPGQLTVRPQVALRIEGHYRSTPGGHERVACKGEP